MYITTKYKKHLNQLEQIRRRVFFKCTQKQVCQKRVRVGDGTYAEANITFSRHNQWGRTYNRG